MNNEVATFLWSACWILITVIAYVFAFLLFRRTASSPWCHPLPVTALIVGTVLFSSDVSIDTFREHAGLLHWLLGPATVALAVPLYKQWHQIRSDGVRMLVPVIAGGVMACVMAVAVLVLFDTPDVLTLSMLTKSITTPLAMETSELIGGAPSLAAIFVIITGIVGAVFASAIFTLINVRCPKCQGIALGTVAHAVGTSRAVLSGESASAFATVALCINGILTSIVLAWLFSG
ncbi:LrgB family protein [Aestuariibacter salexigens]|uniref:LrgB family protein n=1 Tax=Aestuariibacter salexigens TaxID=226010 RepID=UPI00041361B9|nr:LrgB family protein [Aestuariibacter salexigens]